MTDLPEVPHRRHQLDLKLQADTTEDLTDELRSIADRIDAESRLTYDLTCGAPRAGYHLDLTTDPEMDHDLYVLQLQARQRAIHRQAKDRAVAEAEAAAGITKP